MNIKFLKKFKLSAFIICLVVIFSTQNIYAGNIKRGCTAEYYGSITKITPKAHPGYSSLNIAQSVISLSYREKQIQAEAGCGKLVPNRCRQRARDKLIKCAKAHASTPNSLPADCKTDKVKKYPIQNLTNMIKAKACGSIQSKDGIRISTLLKKPYDVEMLLSIYIHGSDHCGLKKPGTTMIEGQKYGVRGNIIYLRQPLKKFAFSCR